MLHKNFKEFVEYLEAHGAKYLVVGGYAVAFHGHPRYTGDLDLWVETGPDNADRVLAAFADFDMPNTVSREDFLGEPRFIAVGEEPLRLHVMTAIPGVSFEECYEQRVFMQDGNLQIPVISLPDLIANKKATGRTRDQQDISELEKARDREKCRSRSR